MVLLLWPENGQFMPRVIVANLKVKQMLRSKSDLAANDLYKKLYVLTYKIIETFQKNLLI